MNIRLYHALLLTMEENRSIFEGEVWIKDERIRYVGDGSDQDVSESCAFFGCSVKEDILWDEEIDCQGNLLMPGFKNAHTHSGMTLLRSYADVAGNAAFGEQMRDILEYRTMEYYRRRYAGE